MFEWWTNKGLLRIADICDHRGILTRRALEDKHQLLISEFFRCSQIVHFLSTISKNSDMATMTPMQYFCTQYKIRGHISEIYTVLTNCTEKFEYMKRWEADLQESIELDEWHKKGQGATKSIINISLIANFKVLMRWYMVPARLATFLPEASPRCFCGCGQLGTMYHIWWQCPKVRRYWIRVYNFIYTLTQVNLIKSPKRALLGAERFSFKISKASSNNCIYSSENDNS